MLNVRMTIPYPASTVRFIIYFRRFLAALACAAKGATSIWTRSFALCTLRLRRGHSFRMFAISVIHLDVFASSGLCFALLQCRRRASAAWWLLSPDGLTPRVLCCLPAVEERADSVLAPGTASDSFSRSVLAMFHLGVGGGLFFLVCRLAGLAFYSARGM